MRIVTADSKANLLVVRQKATIRKPDLQQLEITISILIVHLPLGAKMLMK